MYSVPHVMSFYIVHIEKGLAQVSSRLQSGGFTNAP